MSTEAFPPLPSSTMQETPSLTTEPLSDGLVCLNGKVYQLIPAPHNVVTATSTIPSPTMVPCTLTSGPTVSTFSVATPTAPTSSTVQAVAPSTMESVATSAVNLSSTSVATPTAEVLTASQETPKEGLEFAMPVTLPPKKASRSRSRSSSRRREKRKSPQALSEITVQEIRPTGRGHGKKRPEMTNAPILIPTTHSHLISKTKPKPGLTVALSAKTAVPKSVQHLSQLTTEASVPLDVALSSEPSANTIVTIDPQPLHDDSDVDLETGEVLMPLRNSVGLSKFAYKLKPNSDDYEAFAQAIITKRLLCGTES